MKQPRLTYLLVSILLLSFSDGWAEFSIDVTGDVSADDLAKASKVKQIGSVLNLFSGDASTWPIQQEDRWCWASSAEIIMRSHGTTSWKQCIQADDAFPGRSSPRTCCDDSGSPLCNRSGWPHFEYYGFNAPYQAEPLPWEKLKDEMDQERPVAVAVQYRDPANLNISLGGHMGVIAGYAELAGGGQAILAVDPDGFHLGMWALYDDVFGNSSDTSRHWRSYYDIRPLHP